jgi:chromosome segregation ATPase
MDDKREFKINLHAGDDDDLNTTKVINQPSKQSTIIPTLSIVFSLLAFVGMIGFIYYNLNTKIKTINTRGSAGIESLANEFNDKFSEFSQQFSSQQETIRALQSNLDTKLKKIDASLSATKTTQTAKLDKKDLDSAIKSIQDDLFPLQESIKNFNEQLSGIQDETKQITINLNKVQTGVLNNNKEISTLDAIQIDRVEFEQKLKKEREFNQQNMAHASEALFSEIATLHQLIKDLEKKLVRTSISTSKSKTTKSPSDTISIPKPGEIIEQEIK